MTFAVTVPDTVEMIVGEQLNFQVDFSGVIGSSTAIWSPIVLVTTDGVNEFHAEAVEGVHVSDSTLYCTLKSGALRSRTNYIVTFSATTTNTGITTYSATISAQNLMVVDSSLVTWGDWMSINKFTTIYLTLKVIY